MFHKCSDERPHPISLFVQSVAIFELLICFLTLFKILMMVFLIFFLATFQTRIDFEARKAKKPTPASEEIKKMGSENSASTTSHTPVHHTTPRETATDSAANNNNNGNYTNDNSEEEIEEGEMLDYSSSSSWAPEDESQRGLDVSAKDGATSPISSCSSHFYSEEEDNSDLPSLFSTGFVTTDSKESPIFIHLPDFEVGFASERPLLPNMDATASIDSGLDEFMWVFCLH